MSGDITTLGAQYERYAAEVDEQIKAYRKRLTVATGENKHEIYKTLAMLHSVRHDLLAQAEYLKHYDDKERKSNYDQLHGTYGAAHRSPGAENDQ